jgi:chromosome transmission fidelity protein 18
VAVDGGGQRCQREVLGWLKEWDRCVFKKIVPGKKRPREGEENIYVS